ncbi:MAG: hypothetical protein ACM3SV_06675 [Betaproteobacteria bacterium]
MLGLLAVSEVFAATLEEDVVRYVGIFNGDPEQHVQAAETLAYAGLSDMRVFDLIESQLLKIEKALPSDRPGKSRMAHYIRALGFSGQAKYITTIERFRADMDYERYVRTALADSPNYRKWNPVISDRATFDPKLSDDVNRVLNMLKSNDLEMKRLGAKRVYFANRDEVLLEQLAKDLTANYRLPQADKEQADCVAWLAKGLGSAKSERYRPLLQEVAISAASDKVREHAKLTLQKYAQ